MGFEARIVTEGLPFLYVGRGADGKGGTEVMPCGSALRVGVSMGALWELFGCDLACRVFVAAANPGCVHAAPRAAM